jgi:hypothetical protein
MSIQEIEAAILRLPRQQMEKLSHWLREHLASLRATSEGEGTSSAYDRVEHLVGLGEGPGDLSTNPRYMEGFGEGALR